MAESEEVRRLAADPNEDQYVSLLVSLEPNHSPTAIDELRDNNSCYDIDDLGFDVFRVIVDQTSIDDVREIEGLESIEVERKIRVLSPGN